MSDVVQQYACGFLFSIDRSHVLLIRKRRPAWQAGRLNGIGGKVEPGETFAQAMQREFREEAFLDLSDWQPALQLSGQDDTVSSRTWSATFFRAFGDLHRARATTDEMLEIHRVDALPLEVIPNLRWIIPLLLDDEVMSGTYRADICHSVITNI